MPLTLTYDAAHARVRITATGLGSATTATVERSVDLVTWTTVRGGADLQISGGALVGTLDDYEFAGNVTNHYRIRYASTVTLIGVGAAVHGDNASLNPAYPPGIATGDLVVVYSAIRNGAAASIGAGWTALADMTTGRLQARLHTGAAAPTVTFTGGAAGDTTSAQIAVFRGAQAALAGAAATQLNASQQNIPTPGVAVPGDNHLLLVAGQKLDDWTSVAPLAAGGFTELGEPSSTLGNDQGIVWDYQVQTVAAAAVPSQFTVTGGAAAVSRSAAVVIPPIEAVLTNSLVPTIQNVWLKSPARPFLNVEVLIRGWSDIELPARNGVFEIIGRSLPVAITDVRASKSYTLSVIVPDSATADAVELLLAGGDILYVQVPSDVCGPPSMYAVAGDTLRARAATGALAGDILNRRIFPIPLRQVAAPGPDVVGLTSTWQTVLSTYGTWSDVIAANATWGDVLELIAAPSEVIVP